MDEKQQESFEQAAKRWALSIERVITTPQGIVAFARRGDKDVVLKLPNADSEETESHSVLRHYNGEGAIRVLAHADGALLLERLRPGRPLSELSVDGRDEEATVIICEVIKELHRRPPPAGPFPAIEEWGRGFDRYRNSGDSHLPRQLVERAAALYFDLAAEQSAPCLLHGDLHHYNIVYDEERGWLAIDPKGVIGEPAYELGAALRNPMENPALIATSSVIERRVQIFAEQLDLDPDRILSWAFAQTVLSVIWSVESKDVYGWLEEWLTVAYAMNELL